MKIEIRKDENMFKKKRTIFICILALVLTGLWTFRYVKLNQRYPQPNCESYSVSQPVLLDNFEILVSDSYFLDSEAAKEALIVESEAGLNAKCIVLDFSVTNISDSPQNIEVGAFQLQSGAWHNGVSFIAYRDMNSDVNEGSLNLQIEPGETCQVKLPFSMIDFHFFPDDWDYVEDRQYELVLSFYSIKRVLCL